LITGCFSQKENANNHIQTLKEQGFDAYLVDIQGGLHRVAALGVDQESDLSTASKKLSEREISFWTLNK
jgi:cell division septation protein DedD